MSHALEEALDQLQAALNFRDLCRRDPRAGETGALRDALEWLESAAQDVCTAAEGEMNEDD